MNNTSMTQASTIISIGGAGIFKSFVTKLKIPTVPPPKNKLMDHNQATSMIVSEANRSDRFLQALTICASSCIASPLRLTMCGFACPRPDGLSQNGCGKVVLFLPREGRGNKLVKQTFQSLPTRASGTEALANNYSIVHGEAAHLCWGNVSLILPSRSPGWRAPQQFPLTSVP